MSEQRSGLQAVRELLDRYPITGEGGVWVDGVRVEPDDPNPFCNQFAEGTVSPPGDTLDQEALRAYRAGGDVRCEVCGKPYRKHPFTEHRFNDGPYLNRLCDGRIVKL